MRPVEKKNVGETVSYVITDKKEKYEIIRTKEQYAAWRIAHRTLRMRCFLHRWHGLGESCVV